MIRKWFPVTVMILALGLVLTCSRDDTLYNPEQGGPAVTCEASIVSGDTNVVTGTFHTFDTLTFTGVVTPANANVSAAWDFGDNTQAEGREVRHAYAAGGTYRAVFKIWDAAGVSLYDTVTLVINTPPEAPILKTPSSGAPVQWYSTPIFSWHGADAEDPQALRYDLYISPYRVFADSHRVVSAQTDTSYQWESGGDTKTYFWKVVAFDGLDTTESGVDSFYVGQYQIGHIYGYVRLEGVQRHNGIKVTFQGGQTYSSFTDDSGYCAVDVTPHTYNLTAVDTLRGAFETQVRSGIDVQPDDSVSFGTIVLQDVHAPHIACTYPPQGVTLTNLSSGDLTVTGTFSDTGSQVHVDSVRVTLNGAPVANVTRTSDNWQFTVSNIADGHYTVRVNAADSAGNPAAELVRSFNVNSKTVDAHITFYHDTLLCTVSVANVRTNIRMYYLNYDLHATPAWNDSVPTSNLTLTRAWPLSHPPAAGPDTFIVMTVDDSGMAVCDTVSYTVTNDAPAAFAGNDTVVAIGASFINVTLHGTYAQAFGHATRYDWSINNGSFLRTSIGDTTILLSPAYHPGIPCVLRVTDDKGHVDQDTVVIAVGRDWVPVGGTDIAAVNGNAALGVFSDNEMYLAFSDPANLNKIKVLKWDGGTWSTVGSGFSSGNVSFVQMVVGTGLGYGGVQYSVPYVAFSDGGDFKVKVYKPNGTAVGTASLIDGQYGMFRMTVTADYMDGTPYLGFGDNLAGDAVKVKRYVYSMNPYDWVQVGVNASTSASRVREVVHDLSYTYVLLKAGLADTLKRLNGTAWQTVDTLYPRNNPTLLLTGGALYCADRDASAANQLTVKRLSGSAWTQVGPALTNSPSGVNNYDDTGNLGMVGLQWTGGYLCAAFKEWDEGGIGDTLRVKAYDGAWWNPVGLSGLPTARVGFNKGSFVAKNGKIYLAYRSPSNMVTVLQLR